MKWFEKQASNEQKLTEAQGKFRAEEQKGRLERILNKVIQVFGDEKITVPEAFDVIANLIFHLNRDVIRILNEAHEMGDKLKEYDKKQ